MRNRIIILIRHGQCVSNIGGQYSVSTDADDVLTELGKEQATQTGQFFKNLVLSNSLFNNLKIISSDLERAKQTSSIIKSINPSLLDVSYDERLREKNKEETINAVLKRVKDVFSENDQQDLMIITHGHVLESIFSHLLFDFDSQIQFFNCGISIIKGSQILTINSITHLLNF